MNRIIKNLIWSFSAFCLAACTSMPLSTLWRLKTLEPLEVNPKEVAVAIRAPSSIDLAWSTTTLNLGFVPEAPAAKIDEYFNLVMYSEDPLPLQFMGGVQRGEKLNFLKLSDEDTKRFALMQERIKNYKLLGGKGESNISVLVKGFCLIEALNPDEAKINIYIKFSLDESFILLLKNLSLMQPGLAWTKIACQK